MSEISETLTDIKKRTIVITMDTYEELVKIGGYDETMDQIVRKCVEAYKREQARGGRK
jgi:predicted CopG family antitoxin